MKKLLVAVVITMLSAVFAFASGMKYEGVLNPADLFDESKFTCLPINQGQEQGVTYFEMFCVNPNPNVEVNEVMALFIVLQEPSTLGLVSYAYNYKGTMYLYSADKASMTYKQVQPKPAISI